MTMDEWTIKTTNPICRLFFEIDLLTGFAALCLIDFIDWRYIHSFTHDWYFRTSLWPMDKLYLCTVAPLPSLWPPPPPFPKLNVQYSGGGGGGVGVLNCAVHHILQEFYTLCFWSDSEPTKLLHHPKLKCKDDIKVLVSFKFLRPCKWPSETYRDSVRIEYFFKV
jgi:hypothetical protein